MTFKTFIKESVENDFHHEVDSHIKYGQIVKPEYEDLKRRVNRHIEKRSDVVFNKHVPGRGKELYDDGVGDLIYSTPKSSNEVLSLKKKLAATKNKSHPFYKDLESLHHDLSPLSEKIKHLKGMVVTTKAVRAVAKEKESVAQKKKFGDTSSLTKVLSQHLEEFKQKAHERAGEQYDSHMETLKKHNWDLDKAAPRPHSRMSRADYRYHNDRRSFLKDLTEGDGSIRKMSKVKKAMHQEQAKKDAHGSYMAWVSKLTSKIGKPTTHAEMTGNPWTGSRIKVKTNDGEEQTWNTKMIINQSKYSKLFNQFPTRRAK